MLTVISPAKSLNEAPVAVTPTEPGFADEALKLAKTGRNLTLTELKGLMDLSDALARLNRDRFRAFKADPARADVTPAAWLFAGDTYQGLEAATLDADALRWADDHLRILSGLYGLLAPRDGIQPYRLEMGTRLATRRGKSLYEFWGDRIAKALNAQAEAVGTGWLLNCASQEYFAAADHPKLRLKVVTPVFLEEKDGARKTVSFYAKRARGALARFAQEVRVTEPAALRDFRTGGYRFDAEASTGERPIFARPWPESAAA